MGRGFLVCVAKHSIDAIGPVVEYTRVKQVGLACIIYPCPYLDYERLLHVEIMTDEVFQVVMTAGRPAYQS